MNPDFRPMLAGRAPADLTTLRYPVIATPKIDGIRCITTDLTPSPGHTCVPLTRSLKPIPNRHVYGCLARDLSPGFDGELVAPGESFQRSTGSIMAHHGEPDFRYMIFDMVPEVDPSIPYWDRARALQIVRGLPDYCEVLQPWECRSHEDLVRVIGLHIDQGYEGTCVRSPGSPYKYGRSTTHEQYLLKIKTFVDAEAKIVGFQELRHNDNPPETSELGYKVRSTHQSLMIPGNTLGSLVVTLVSGHINDSIDDVNDSEAQTFNIGSGFDQAMRDWIWLCRDDLVGKIVKFKYQPHGSKDRPRIPIFLGFRDPLDT